MYYPPQITQITVKQPGPSFVIRALWYLFIGYWLGFCWLNLGFFFCLTIIGLPLGLVMLNRLPQVMTLRMPNQQVSVTIAPGVTNINIGPSQPKQVDMLIRVIYFLLVGWWAGYLWALTGYLLCALLITLPLGIIMLNNLPMVLTLRKG
jgi:uncharacterized membrane protein YccF (DUF307 family)